MRRRGTLARLALLLLAASPLTAELFNGRLTQDERERLARGEIVIRNINATDGICVEPGASEETDMVAGAMREANANYLSEVLWSIPASPGDGLTGLAESFFRDMQTFREIPYHPDASGRTEPLFTVADLLGTETDGTETLSTARFCMEPFGPYPASLYMRRTERAFVFLHTNSGKIKLAIVRAIGAGAMRAGIAVVRDGERWVVYGAGGIRGPKPPLLRKSLERAFNNRIRDFASFYIRKVQEAVPSALPEARQEGGPET